jgi:hypothetical protein
MAQKYGGMGFRVKEKKKEERTMVLFDSKNIWGLLAKLIRQILLALLHYVNVKIV